MNDHEAKNGVRELLLKREVGGLIRAAGRVLSAFELRPITCLIPHPADRCCLARLRCCEPEATTTFNQLPCMWLARSVWLFIKGVWQMNNDGHISSITIRASFQSLSNVSIISGPFIENGDG